MKQPLLAAAFPLMSVSSEPSSWLQSSLTPHAFCSPTGRLELRDSGTAFVSARRKGGSFQTLPLCLSPLRAASSPLSPRPPEALHAAALTWRPLPEHMRSGAAPGAGGGPGRAGGALRLSLPPRAPARPRYRITAKLHPRSTPIYIQIARVPAFMSPVKGLAKGGCNPISRSFKGMSAE